MERIRSHKDLKVYQLSYDLAMEIFNISKSFPKEERYALTSQIRNSSRSVAANLAEAFRKRRYKKAFIAKLSDSEGEASETQTWIDFAKDCKYLTPETCDNLNQKYEHVIGMLVNMIHSADQWTIGE
ncbi:MAG: four helix bundle protein [Balneolaceae bacterium]|nr:four helix bundle protein [Balneolaceae bacterium]MDR9410756.1 four helix bundle protein [Balneolaceae bacterium]